MPKQPPPLRPLAIAVVLSGLRARIPVSALALLVLGLIAALSIVLDRPLGLQESLVEPLAPEQRWTVGPGAMASLAPWAVRGALPAPDPRQRRPPCDDSVGEVELEGACWIWLGKPPPCPQGKAWEHGGRCYMAVLKVERLPRDPTSGEGRPIGVADP